MYAMAPMHKWAIFHLSKLPYDTITNTNKLKLSIKFEVKSWLDGAFCSMAVKHFDDISVDDLRLMGIEMLIILSGS